MSKMKAIKTFRDLLVFLHITRLGKAGCLVAGSAEAILPFSVNGFTGVAVRCMVVLVVVAGVLLP